MNVQDFFSVVQLGVGIHAGTAFLQLSSEMRVAPTERRLENVGRWINEEKVRAGTHITSNIEEEFDEIQTNLRVYRQIFQNKYTIHSCLTFGFGAAILFMLCVMSFIADTKITELTGLFIVLFSICPALFIFISFWHDSSQALRPIEDSIAALERKIVT